MLSRKRPIVACSFHICNQYTVRKYKFENFRLTRNVFSLALVLMLLHSNLQSQEIKGKIISSQNKQAIPGVSVIADDTVATVSDSEGNYKMTLVPGKHSVIFRLISFHSETRLITLGQNEELVLNISLDEDVRELGIVVVSAGRFEQNLEEVTVSMEVLKPEMIEKRNSFAMDEAVDFIPGVNVIDGQANIRGGSGWSYGAGSRVQILVDDLPQLTADANDAKWNFLPLENLEQVEVIKGASSVLFGSSALNGVINIRTAYPRDTPSTKINLSTGFYDKAYITTDRKYSLNYHDGLSFYHGVNFLHSRKIDRLDLVAGGNFFKDNGYRQGENETRGRVNVNLRYRFKVDGLSAGIHLNTMINDATIFFLWKNDTSGAYLPAINTLSESKTYRTNIDPYITYAGKKGSVHKLRTRWFNTTNKNNTDQDSKGDLFYAEYQYQKQFSKSLTLTTGLVNSTSIVSSELYGDHDGNQFAGYLQADYKWRKFSFSAGGRAEKSQVDAIKDTLTPVFRAGINYHVFERTYMRASAGQGYRFPSIAERFIKTTVGGANIFPNPGLASENGTSMEIAIRQIFQFGKIRGYIDAAVFQNEYENMIEFAFAFWEPALGIFEGNGFKSVNVGDTKIRGLEFTTGMEFNTGKEAAFVFQAGYTFLDPRQLTYDSTYVSMIGDFNVLGSDSTNFLKYRYEHLVRADLDFTFRAFSAGMSARYNSRMINIDKIFTNGILDGFFSPGLGIGDYRKYHRGGDLVLDMRVGYQVTKNVELSLSVKNILNHIYMQRPADMQPPRTFTFIAGVKF